MALDLAALKGLFLAIMTPISACDTLTGVSEALDVFVQRAKDLNCLFGKVTAKTVGLRNTIGDSAADLSFLSSLESRIKRASKQNAIALLSTKEKYAMMCEQEKVRLAQINTDRRFALELHDAQQGANEYEDKCRAENDCEAEHKHAESVDAVALNRAAAEALQKEFDAADDAAHAAAEAVVFADEAAEALRKEFEAFNPVLDADDQAYRVQLTLKYE
jgi:hypothetical protein